MTKTIEQILNEALVGKHIITNNKVGTIRSVSINKTGGNNLGSMQVEVSGVLCKIIISQRWSDFNFTELGLDSLIAELDISIKSYNILKSNDINFIKDLINKDPTSDGTYGFRRAGKVFANEIKELFAMFM